MAFSASSSNNASIVLSLTAEIGNFITDFDIFGGHRIIGHNSRSTTSSYCFSSSEIHNGPEFQVTDVADTDNSHDEFCETRSRVNINHADIRDSVEDASNSDPSDDNVAMSNKRTDHPVCSSLKFAGIDERGLVSSNVFMASNGTRYWNPIVPDDYVPSVGTTFKTWDEVYNMYDTYAKFSGFSIRLGTMKKIKGVLTHRYIMCTRAGKPKLRDFDSSNINASTVSRRSSFKVSDCKACIKLKVVPGSTDFFLYGFVETHNHRLIDSDNTDFTKKRRKLEFSDQHFIYKMSLNNVGPNVAHNLRCSLQGGHHNVHGNKTDYKNFTRDIRLFIGDKDAQMLIDTLTERTGNLHRFFFDFAVSGHDLISVFWADDVSLCNYEAFGDVLAFDATYQTNMYNMIFVPFTGVDYHKKCVTFGAGLLNGEKIESYKWLLGKFLEAHKKQPRLILTDQDPSMKQAIPLVFDESVHRLCMWHIMRKLPVKISGDLLDNTDLRSSIHKLVWNLFITPTEFEERWHLLLDKYHLNNHPWLTDMYDIRDQWVPCYFRDIQMCCLMKTTSRCESSNSSFKVNSNSSNTLVQFLARFDTAIDRQRNNQRKLEFDSDTTTPLMLTHLPIEKYASNLYTRTIFLEVQKEIQKGLLYCFIVSAEVVDGLKHYTVAHSNKMTDVINEFKVTLDPHDNTASCSCMNFTRIGYLCRHVFCVFRFNKVTTIPKQHQIGRWARDALPRRVHDLSNRYSVDKSEESILRNEIMNVISQCTDRLRRNRDQLSLLLEKVKELKKFVFEDSPNDPDYNSKAAVITDLIGVPVPATVSIYPPQGIRNKGCGTKRRLIGPGEKAVEQHKKAARLCGMCHEYVHDHDSRNCLKIKAAKEAAAAAAKEAAAAAATAASTVASTSAYAATAAAPCPVAKDVCNADPSTIAPADNACPAPATCVVRRSARHAAK